MLPRHALEARQMPLGRISRSCKPTRVDRSPTTSAVRELVVGLMNLSDFDVGMCPPFRSPARSPIASQSDDTRRPPNARTP